MLKSRAPIKRAGDTKQNIRTICTCTEVVAHECDRRIDRPADCIYTEQDPELALRRYGNQIKARRRREPIQNPKNRPRGKILREYRVKEKIILAISRQLRLVAAFSARILLLPT